jgi:trehalose 6-phosphate phosphatase
VRYLLSTDPEVVLRPLGAADTLLAFDFDGTLAPVVRDPSNARMRPTTAGLLGRLARRYPCAVISGRARDDVARLLAGCDVRYVVGNHGIEWGDEASDRSAELATRVTAWRNELAGVVEKLPGAVLEDKVLSLAVHLRNVRATPADLEVLRAAAVRLEGARVFGGKHTVNVVPAGLPGKGHALARIMALAAARRAVFVGDEVTDEDAFAAAGSLPVLTIRVGCRGESRAAWCLRSQREIDPVLETLITLRS